MAKGSMPWNDQGGGDGNPTAELFTSPYNSTEWQSLWNAILGSSQPVALVIPGIGGGFNVTQPGAGANMSVDVAPGEALVNGTRVKYDATENLVIDAVAANPRIDRIVLRWTAGITQTVRLAVVKGGESATPSLPALTQSAAVYEVDLAHVWVAVAAGSITNERISDKRVFMPNLFAAPYLSGDNLIECSEFLGYFPSRIYPPARWTVYGSPSGFQTNTRPSQMARGYAVQITADAADEGMYQTFSIPASTPVAIKLLINVTAGDVGKIVVTTNAAVPGTITREIRRTGTWLEETVYYTSEADASTMTVRVLAANNGDIVQVGQVLALVGYNAGPFRMINPGATVQLIDEIELTADGNPFDFQNIPQYFRHLRLETRLRTDAAQIFDAVNLKINNDSTANYDNLVTDLHHNAVLATAENLGQTSGLAIGNCAGNNAPANTFSPSIVDILDYVSTTKKHEFIGYQTTVEAESTTNINVHQSLGHFRVTGAITRLTAVIVVFGTTFKAGSRMSLYGVK